MQQFKNNVNINRSYVLDRILPVFAPFRQQKNNFKQLQFCVSEQHDSVLILNESTV